MKILLLFAAHYYRVFHWRKSCRLDFCFENCQFDYPLFVLKMCCLLGCGSIVLFGLVYDSLILFAKTVELDLAKCSNNLLRLICNLITKVGNWVYSLQPKI